MNKDKLSVLSLDVPPPPLPSAKQISQLIYCVFTGLFTLLDAQIKKLVDLGHKANILPLKYNLFFDINSIEFCSCVQNIVLTALYCTVYLLKHVLASSFSLPSYFIHLRGLAHQDTYWVTWCLKISQYLT